MKTAFIGGGNMASALIGGLLSSGFAAENIIMAEPDAQKRSVWKEKGIYVTDDNLQAEAFADIVVFAVKPNIIPTVLSEMKGSTDKIYLSIAAGVSLSFLEEKLGADKKLVRAMPNTPAQVGCGMTVICPNKNLSDNETDTVKNLLSAVGEVLVMPEKHMSIATALHGSSPAYVYMLIDAMADAGVSYGLSKAQALLLASKAVEGSARMVLDTGVHPEQLKDNVCSPGGTTIAAVCDLENNGFRSTIQSAIKACVDKAEQMSK